MGYLKSGISRCVAVLSACGVVTVSAVTFATLDKNVIQPCAVMPPENAKVISAVSDKETSEQIGDITTVLTTSAVKKTAKNSQTEAVKAVKTAKSETTKAASETALRLESVTTSVISQKPASVTAVQSVTSADTKLSISVSLVTKKTQQASKSETKVSAVTSAPVSTTDSDTVASKATTAPVTTTTPAVTTTKKKTTTTKVTTTKKPVTTTTTAPVVDNGKTPAQRLNSAVLDPKATLSAKEEKILLKYLNKIISDDMTNYEKAVACYDYIIKNTVYDYGGWANPVKAVLEDGYGTCTEYSYVYAAMLNYIGFDAKTVDGKTAMAAGGYGYHMWVEVTINGQVYVMDPQVDDNMSWGAYISHDRFCKTYSEVKGKYIKD
ncbi:transglutaminase-like domain-containing protein [Ruminococcus bicirculans]|uniref:Transglutaminase-like domain-containing protein n=1 Tax=Ruminococcus bicirculans (ex Wegman et al. 2014) TaxID=1160721 RepID=A0AAW6EK46_9FIRM|nr:transglutaminase domain-containing protein [Ruminococcus bicirculans (ex Wegman et al. 2014)]MDB8750187.1 transglutaminase-like domain-containing protein [Ruminococcus bicirculans (ex Wegman et al. 2014)]